jgi:hypothetical protein
MDNRFVVATKVFSPSFRRKPESIVLLKIKMDPGFRRDDDLDVLSPILLCRSCLRMT